MRLPGKSVSHENSKIGFIPKHFNAYKAHLTVHYKKKAKKQNETSDFQSLFYNVLHGLYTQQVRFEKQYQDEQQKPFQSLELAMFC